MSLLVLPAVVCGGAFEHAGCHAEWSETELAVGNGLFVRRYAAMTNGLVTTSLRAGDFEWITNRTGRASAPLRVSATVGRRSSVGAEGLRVAVGIGARGTVLWLFPGVAGVLREESFHLEVPTLEQDAVTAYSKGGENKWVAQNLPGADVLWLKPLHVLVCEHVLKDMTDIRDELYEEHAKLLSTCDAPFGLHACVASVENVLGNEGLVFLKLAPLPEHRRSSADFAVGAHGRNWCEQNSPWFAVVPDSYPVFELAYAGGEAGRIAALQAAQRALRAYRPGRDGVFLTNTWGDSNLDSRINADFLMKEVVDGADLGVDVVQVDDGWQKGKSANSALITNVSAGAWSNFRSFDSAFWTPDPVRFPLGLKPIVDAAKARGLEFGLWFGPDSTDDCASWEADARTLLDFAKNDGVRYFKIDAIHMESPTAYTRQKKMFSKMLEESNGEMVFDLDVTGVAHRPGYFGLPETGPSFVENRYWKNARYWPHRTLRNLWSLMKVIDPVRLRMEMLNNRHGLDQYPDSPLAPCRYRMDTLFAMVLVASPLGWFETSELSPDSVVEMKPLIARWKAERTKLHGGVTFPVGERPDGVAWTGFITRGADGKSVYVLLFRELNERAHYVLDLKPFVRLSDSVKCEILSGRGDVHLSDGGAALSVDVPGKLDYVWVRIRRDAE